MSEQFNRQAERTGLTVVVYTAWNIITGVVYPRGIARLSDASNNWEDMFVPLEDARFIDPASGQAEPQSRGTLLLPRNEILLLHEVPAGDAPQRGGDEDMRVQKQVLLVQTRIGPYRVDGTLYVPQYSTLSSHLNRGGETFVPLTEATIVLPAGERPRQVHVPFVLICHGCILVNEARLGGTGDSA
jgi:hypothetical protein